MLKKVREQAWKVEISEKSKVRGLPMKNFFENKRVSPIAESCEISVRVHVRGPSGQAQVSLLEPSFSFGQSTASQPTTWLDASEHRQVRDKKNVAIPMKNEEDRVLWKHSQGSSFEMSRISPKTGGDAGSRFKEGVLHRLIYCYEEHLLH